MNFSTNKLKTELFFFFFPVSFSSPRYSMFLIIWVSECVIDAEIAERTRGFQMGRRKRKYYISKTLHFFNLFLF